MSFRKERKFRLTASDARLLKSRLLGEGMTLLFPDRKISSLYFDTPDLKGHADSEEGTLPRYKIRVRWYNDDQTKLHLERKTSSIEGRFKTSHEINEADFASMKRRGIVDKDYGLVSPCVTISYLRSYFDHKNLRITFDRDIKYIFSNGGQAFREFEEVVEIKAPFEVSDDTLEAMVATPTQRFSKYGRSHLARAGGL